ncbi:hypothetical protein [Microbispora sp. NPDC049125]|uniref:hypothetical protein n=1 Tax=Microbispora sp. NPDC049125 TaxID=3154929 RepID=UPI0034661630
MKSYRVRVAAALAAAAVALTACGPVQAGSAAIVGKERITSSDLDSQIRAFRKDLAAYKIPEDKLQLALPLPQMMLFNMANSRQLIELGRMKGVTVTQREIDDTQQAILKSQSSPLSIEQILLSNAIPLSERENAIRAIVIRQKLAEQAGGGADEQSQQAAAQKVTQEADSAVPVRFSPRYGKFDPQQGFVADDRFGAVGAAQPAAQAAPPQS